MTETSSASPPNPTPAHVAAARDLAAAAPWIDVHAHPGRCFLAGLPLGHPLAVGLGGERTTEALGEIAGSGVSSVAFSTVADLLVLTVRDHGLAAGRPFEPGEAGPTTGARSARWPSWPSEKACASSAGPPTSTRPTVGTTSV